ncbi:mitochondrial chaperone (BCS1), putative [Aspergillus fumigatus A1163]|uniref:Mitochondrial chaperone (BCS1), putative n=1 Tax=Aspergillus fumigatus (strain CBS 144.89 / FGSC A1163 / CEA10) TaxID=451804 RepID=B0XXI9_ASPFC|nr:mitochondrial chaperone (BCS1), putative [Aspergillus fumigatus A1163]
MSNSSRISPETLLDTLWPGFGLFSRLISLYLHIDLSLYSFYIFSITIFWVFVTFMLPKLLHELQHLFLHYAASVEIMFQDKLYGQTIRWISNHCDLSQSRRSIAGTKASYIAPWLWKDEDDEQEEEEEHRLVEENQRGERGTFQTFWQYFQYLNKRRIIRYTPKKGELHLFWYRGRIFGLYRQATSKGDNLWSAHMENIMLYTGPWNQQLLRELMDEIQEESHRQESNHITIYRGMKQKCYEWVPIARNLRRSLSTMVLDHEQRSTFLTDIKDFLQPATHLWYRKRDIPYRRGYLFHGPPGTGKSSLCFATASLLGLDVYVCSLNSNGLNENGFSLLFRDLPRRWSITLSSLLNELDGVGAKEGQILIMTTNYRDRLDSALLRPRRVDMEVAFDYASTPIIQGLFLAFYTSNGDEQSNRRFTPAEIQNYLLHHRENPVSAIAKATEWVQKAEQSLIELAK